MPLLPNLHPFPAHKDWTSIVLVSLLVSALLVGVIALLVSVRSVRTISHDSSISILAATGHQDAYAQSNLHGRWVRAEEWQRFWRPEEAGCFRIIARDLGTYDIHPPLYFWILHVWFWFFGVTTVTGPALNVLFHLGTTVSIFWVSRLLRFPAWIALFCAAYWLLSPANSSIATDTRQYSLLATTSICFTGALIRFLLNAGRKSFALLACVSMAGMLTHYHFFIVAASSLIPVSLALGVKRDWVLLLRLAGCIALGTLGFLALHPAFLSAILRQQAASGTIHGAGILPRLETFTGAVSEQILYFYAPLLVAPICLLLLGGILLSRWMSSDSSSERRESMDSVSSRVVAFLPAGSTIICLGAVGFLYLTFRSPVHAMSAKYISFASPLIVVGMGQLLHLLSKKNRLLTAAAVLSLIITQTSHCIESAAVQNRLAAFPRGNPLREGSVRAIIDSTARGVVGPVLIQAAADTQVFVASQQELVGNDFPALDTGDTVIYISSKKYENTAENQSRILQQFEARDFVLSREGGLRVWGDVTFRAEAPMAVEGADPSLRP